MRMVRERATAARAAAGKGGDTPRPIAFMVRVITIRKLFARLQKKVVVVSLLFHKIFDTYGIVG